MPNPVYVADGRRLRAEVRRLFLDFFAMPLRRRDLPFEPLRFGMLFFSFLPRGLRWIADVDCSQRMPRDYEFDEFLKSSRSCGVRLAIGLGPAAFSALWLCRSGIDAFGQFS